MSHDEALPSVDKFLDHVNTLQGHLLLLLLPLW